MKNLLIYENIFDATDDLTDEEAGKLFKALNSFRKGEEVVFEDRYLKGLWKGILPNLEKLEENYNTKVKNNQENGKKGGRPKKDKVTSTEIKNDDVTPTESGACAPQLTEEPKIIEKISDLPVPQEFIDQCKMEEENQIGCKLPTEETNVTNVGHQVAIEEITNSNTDVLSNDKEEMVDDYQPEHFDLPDSIKDTGEKTDDGLSIFKYIPTEVKIEETDTEDDIVKKTIRNKFNDKFKYFKNSSITPADFKDIVGDDLCSRFDPMELINLLLGLKANNFDAFWDVVVRMQNSFAN